MNARSMLPCAAVLACAATAAAAAEQALYDVGGLVITEGELPSERYSFDRRALERRRSMYPRVVLEGEGEAYFVTEGVLSGGPFARVFRNARIVVVAPGLQGVTARLYVPEPDGSGMRALEVDLGASPHEHVDEAEVLQARRAHYGRLLRRRIPGAAWFRHQLERATPPGSEASGPAGRLPRPRPSASDVARTYAVFTGGRAVAENLQLDRVLPRVRRQGEPSVPLEDIPGITIEEVDWEPLIEDADPRIDPLAERIPADQHALLLPSFRAMVTLLDEAREQGTPVLRALDPRSEDAKTRERYQRQLCLGLTGLGRLLGPQVVASVAYTGCDPYLRTGSDIAVLFEAREPGLLTGHIAGRQDAAAQANGAEVREERIAGTECRVVRTPDRRISSYMASLGSTVVVTNSPAQLARIVSVHRGERESLASLPEFVFFRERYPRGGGDETALLVVTDATIRRWCGPRWRIATSRRTLAQAAMLGMRAEHLDARVRGEPVPAGTPARYDTESLGELSFGPHGVRSSAYNTPDFLTPIVEMDFDRVTEGEREAYEQWRSVYQRRWRQAFDPIAVRFTVEDERLEADLTVMPLIAGSEYGDLVDVTGEARIAGDAGDRHPESIAHFAMAIDRDSRRMRQLATLGTGMGLRADPLAWLGESIALYADENPFWKEAAAAEDLDDFVQNNFHRLPLGFHAEVRSPLKLAAFLTGLRGMVQSTAPDLTTWDTLEHRGRSYVRIRPAASQRRPADGNEAWEELAIYYAAQPGSLTVTLDEELLHRAMGRHREAGEAGDAGDAESGASREAPGDAEEAIRPWLGRHVALQLRPGALDVARALTREPYRHLMQARSWGNLPILNTWRERFPGSDPLAIYEEHWGARLVCPGGGEYVWNERWRTYESTVYGHPGEPRPGPALPPPLARWKAANLGLTFEHQGLRARARIEREAAGR